jgi:hypothetical protein
MMDASSPLNAPELSVVLATRDSYDAIRKTVLALRAQTRREQIELLLVCPSMEAFGPREEELEGFSSCRIVEFDRIHSIAAANAAGVREATAPLVAFAEDHSFPDPDWALALIDRHREDWAAVGPLMSNGNPATLVSWCDFLIGYGPWAHPQASRQATHLPGHNSCYKRRVLMEYGAALEGMLAAETVLHQDLRAKGHRLYLESAARTDHVNFSRLGVWLRVQYHAGRVFAAVRADGRNILWRLFFTCASPLIPIVRARRAIEQARRANGSRPPVLRLVPLLLIGLTLDGLGQMIGYILGAGNSKTRLSIFEFNRLRYLTEEDRRMVMNE